MKRSQPKPPRVQWDPSSPEGVRLFKRAAEEQMKLDLASKEAAIAALIRTGLLTKSGRLSKRYYP